MDNVSLDVSDASLTSPAVSAASPGNNAVNVDPVVQIAVTLEDRLKAVEVLPDGPSGLVWLAVLSESEGRGQIAAELAGRLVRLPANAIDPWWEYLRGDYARWPSRLATLRDGLR